MGQCPRMDDRQDILTSNEELYNPRIWLVKFVYHPATNSTRAFNYQIDFTTAKTVQAIDTHNYDDHRANN